MDLGVFRALPDLVAATVVLEGEFDQAAVAEFDRAYRLVELVDPPRLTIDLSRLTYMGSAGLGCLIRARSRRGVLLLKGVRAPQRRVLEMTAMLDYFELIDTDSVSYMELPA